MTNKSSEHIHDRLSILVRLDGFSFLAQNFEGTVVRRDHYDFSEKIQAHQLLEQLDLAFQAFDYLQYDYRKVSVVYANELFTMIPEALFDESQLAEYLKFNTKILATDYIAHDTIASQGIVNAYIPFANTNNRFFDAYGSFDFYHAVTLLTTHALDKGAKKDSVLVHVSKTSFDMVVTRDSKLLLANTYTFTTKEDFVYYLLFAFEQLELDHETVPVHCVGEIDTESELYKITYTYIRHLTAATAQNDYLLTLLN